MNVIKKLEIRGKFPPWAQPGFGELAKTWEKAGQFGHGCYYSGKLNSSVPELFTCIWLCWLNFWPADRIDGSLMVYRTWRAKVLEFVARS